MKKLLALALAAILAAVSFSACNKSPEAPHTATISGVVSPGESQNPSSLTEEDKALLDSDEIPTSVTSETTVTTSNGSVVTVKPDGTKTIEKPDGSKVTVNSQGTVIDTNTKPSSSNTTSNNGTSHGAPSGSSSSGASTSTPAETTKPSSQTPSSRPSSTTPSSQPPKPAPSSSTPVSSKPAPPPSSAAPAIDPALKPYYYPYDPNQIKADMIAYGKGLGLTLDTTLNLSNASYDFPVNTISDYLAPITTEKVARKFQKDCKDNIDYTIHTCALADGCTDEEMIDGMRFNIIVKIESNGSYSFYMPYG